jgi:acyl-CoA thioesterase
VPDAPLPTDVPDLPDLPPTDLAASFERVGDDLVPRPFTRSGWSAGTLNGRYLAGLVAWGAERHADADWQPARLTVDMFRPGTMAPTRVETRVVRDGRRIRVVDSSVVVGGVEICRGSTVFLRRSHEPRGETWFPPEWRVPDPDDVEPMPRDRGDWGMPWESRNVTGWGELTERRQVWVRETRPFVEGEELTAFMRAALAADMANGQLNASPVGLAYINADVTMTIARLPEGEWIGLDARSRAAADGVSVGALDVYDAKGRIGQVALIGVADERNLPPGGEAFLPDAR